MKRIAIFSDGTWNAPDRRGATNVLLMARAVRPYHDGVEQVAFYDWGVGTDRRRLLGGLLGAGIDKNITDCYRFLVHNYRPGDQLFFFGFSRGAYTARSLAGFVRNCGILRREHAQRIPEAYRLYRRRSRASHPAEPEATAFRGRYAWADLSPIEFVGVWDTVGALGIPVPFWGTLGEKDFLFHDIEPSKIIRHARHALAIDEAREDFAPTPWSEKPEIDLQQLWFAGAHSNIGGSLADRGLSDLALRWIMREASALGLGFEEHLMAAMRPDHRGKLYDSRRGIYRARGRAVRSIDGPVHVSVKLRWQDNVGNYQRQSRPLRKLLDATTQGWDEIEVVE